MSPSLGVGIGTTYLPAAAAKPGHQVRGRVPRRADAGGGGEAAVLDQGQRRKDGRLNRRAEGLHRFPLAVICASSA